MLHKGCYYKVILYHKGRLLNAREIQFQLSCIVSGDAQTTHAEKNLASLTAGDRVKWAEVREKHFNSGVNRSSLDVIESAAFVLILHDAPFEFDLLDCERREELHTYSKRCMTGNVNEYWFDKSFNITFGTNARVRSDL